MECVVSCRSPDALWIEMRVLKSSRRQSPRLCSRAECARPSLHSIRATLRSVAASPPWRWRRGRQSYWCQNSPNPSIGHSAPPATGEVGGSCRQGGVHAGPLWSKIKHAIDAFATGACHNLKTPALRDSSTQHRTAVQADKVLVVAFEVVYMLMAIRRDLELIRYLIP